MQIRIYAVAFTLPLFATLALADQTQPMMAPAPAASPAAGQAAQTIKPLSEYDIGGMHKGGDAGSGEAAELNGFPGPAHVMQMAAQLGLDDRQIHAVAAIHDEMLQAAKALGSEMQDREHKLDAMFASGNVNEAGLKEATAAEGEIQSQLHFIHLRAHLKTREVLTPEQIAKFKDARAHATADAGMGNHSHTD